MKRASEEQGGGDTKKSSGTGGQLKGMPGDRDDKTDPIERPLRLQSVTLHFVQRTWEEIGAGELKYLPLCQTPYYMFDEAMLGQLNKFKDIWSTAYFHTPKARITNLLMLQDDLINQGGTPLETTAFTQACYMIKYTPTRQLNYFKLGNMTDCRKGTYNTLQYDLSDTQCGEDYSQLIKIGNYQDFEKLAIMPAKVDKYAGYNTKTKPTIITDDLVTIKDIYISPSLDNETWNNFSANLQPRDKLLDEIPVVEPLHQVTWARNLDKFTLHKYGDEIDIPITTNLEGVPLIRHPNNDLSNRVADIDYNGNNYKMYIDLIWPSRNRPYYNRSTNLSDITPFELTKRLQSLSHTFLTMPPIRKANGALLKQRCSFMLEQSFSVTYQTPESIWDDEDAERATMHQADGVILRPVIYGTAKTGFTDQGAICPKGKFDCNGDKCPVDNSITSLIDIVVETWPKMFNWGSTTIGTVVKFETPGALTNAKWKADKISKAWIDWIAGTGLTPGTTNYDYFSFDTGTPHAPIDLTTRDGVRKTGQHISDANKAILFTRVGIRKVFTDLGISCDGSFVQRANFIPFNRVTSLFLC